ncbi:MAG: hypothetical protein KAU31_14515 [Spirochaetaceae bacterium]|nr:hypothetical protein [Spirochaetaceae bacterium]
MKRGILIVAIIALATFALSSCGFVLGMVLKPDLMVEDIQVSVDPITDEITTLRIYFYNNGGDADGVQFVVVLTPDELVSPFAGDYVVYWGSFNIGWNQDVYVDINMAEILETIGEGYVPASDYYIGVMVDPDNQIEEREETDNEGITPDRWLFGGGGSVDLAADNNEPDNNSTEAKPLAVEAPEYHTFHVENDDDWFTFVVPVAGLITLETRAPYGVADPIITDTVIELFDIALDLIASNDDGEMAPYSHLESNLAAGTYFVKVRHSFGDLGEYEIERW